MSITNKWKSSSEDSSISGLSEIDSIESQIREAENEASEVGVRSDWTMQRKMGVAMGIVGAILVVVGIAPMVLDSDNLKGSLADSQQEAADPLVALFGGGNTASTSNSENSTTPDDSQFAATTADTHTTAPLSTDTVSFGAKGTNTSIETGEQPTTVDVTLPENSGDGAFATMNLGGTESSENSNTTISSEVDQIIAEENVIEEGGTPVNLSNANTGTTDTLGSEFMTENPNDSGPQTATETFHASAGLQNTSVSSRNTKLTNSGPADLSLILFLLSLFIVGGVRYRKDLFA